MANKTPQLIILPGWGGSKKTWNEFLVVSRGKFETTLIELPCFGNEPCPESIWGVEEYAKFVCDKLDKKEKYILLGHSFGGQVAAYIAAHNMLPLSGLILSGAAVLRKQKKIKRKLANMFGALMKYVFKTLGLQGLFLRLRPMMYSIIGSPDYTQQEGIQKEIFKKVIRQDMTDILSDISTKTLLLWGRRDGYVPLKDAQKIKGYITGSKLIVYKNGKHGLHHQVLDQYINDIKTFITLCSH